MDTTVSAAGPPSTARVVVVEDEETLADAIALRLRVAGYDVDVANDGATGLELCDPLPDLVLLDWMLPDIDGLEVCRRLRARGEVPVLMLTARTTEQDVVAALAAGADDHLPKPIGMRELTARVAALLRLVGRQRGQVDRTPRRVGDVVVDPTARTVTLAGELVHLTATEFALLERLVDRRGAVVARAALLREVWDLPADVRSRTLDTHVAELRRKLGRDVVRTVHGVGYAAGLPDRDGGR